MSVFKNKTAQREGFAIDTLIGPDMTVRGRLEFLSTQGVGRIKVAAYDDAGTLVASVGWVYTGPLPPGGSRGSIE